MSTITCYKTCLKDAAYEGKLKKGGGSQASSLFNWTPQSTQVKVI